MIRTYLDSGVLIAAARGIGPLGDRALALISEVDSRELVSSDLVKFETVPKPAYFGRIAELDFYESFFAMVSVWAKLDSSIMHKAFEEACRSGLSWADAAHVIMAVQNGCDELITTERPSSAIHRTRLINVESIDA